MARHFAPFGNPDAPNIARYRSALSTCLFRDGSSRSGRRLVETTPSIGRDDAATAARCTLGTGCGARIGQRELAQAGEQCDRQCTGEACRSRPDQGSLGSGAHARRRRCGCCRACQRQWQRIQPSDQRDRQRCGRAQLAQLFAHAYVRLAIGSFAAGFLLHRGPFRLELAPKARAFLSTA